MMPSPMLPAPDLPVPANATVAIFGACSGAVNFKLSGTVGRGDRLIQAADGTFTGITGAGSSGNVIVGVANKAGVSGDLCPGFLIAPRIV